ncbi:MAG: GntG family PLP-dependent aldolase, partial [Vulcanimicrobiaceae bacterium]
LFYYEVAGVAALGGVQVRTIPNRRGLLDPAEIERAIRGENIHFPRTTLLCLENTHNRGGGLAIGVAETAAMTAVARRHGVAVHLDGARLFNAAVALGVEPRALTAAVDSVNVCFSKGLGAPIGSAIAGSHAFVERARKVRKMLGGGMRQVGVIAAAALLALRDGPKRLHVDHENARLFAQKLSESGDFVIAGDVATNIVVFSVARPDPSAADDAALLKRWADNGVLIAPFGPNLFRAVTHLDVSRDQVLEAADRIVADSPVPAAAR